MDENSRKVNILLSNKEKLSIDTVYNDNPLLGEKNDIKPSNSFVVSASSADVFSYKEEVKTKYTDFLRKIGADREFIGDSLASYSRRLKDAPFLATSLIPEIIEKDITGDESAFIELFDILRHNCMYKEAYILSKYADIILNERNEIGEAFYMAVISFGTASKEIWATNFAHECIDRIANDKDAKRYMSIEMYSTICEYFFQRIHMTPWHEKNVLFSEGIGWAEKMIEFQNTKEGGYFWYASFLLCTNRKIEAENYLRKHIYDPPDPRRDSFARLLCPKCCQLYLEEFRERIPFDQLEMIILKGLGDCIVFKSNESSERKQLEQYFRNQLHRLNAVRDTNNNII